MRILHTSQLAAGSLIVYYAILVISQGGALLCFFLGLNVILRYLRLRALDNSSETNTTFISLDTGQVHSQFVDTCDLDNEE